MDLRHLTINDVVSKSIRVDAFIIDGENDFLATGEEPDDWPKPFGGHRPGALRVVGAAEESLLVAAMIDRLVHPRAMNGHVISKIHPSLDGHHKYDGSHNIAWMRPDRTSPPPFTQVYNKDIRDGLYLPRFPLGVWDGKPIKSREWALRYTDALESNGRSILTLWPVHCEIATWGSNLYYPLQQALSRWCDTTTGWLDFISKGQWVWSEHYSAIRCDVPDTTVAQTQFNAAVVDDAIQADVILWAGWAGSHCLRWTAVDFINYLGANDNKIVEKSIFFEDACAAVADIPNPTNDPAIPKFSQWRQDFLNEVQNRGGTVMKTTEFLAA